MTTENDETEPSPEELEEAIPDEDAAADDYEGDEYEADGDGDGEGDDADDADGDESDEAAGDDEEALDELEAEELEMLTEDEASETIVPDEAAEMRAIRRAEIAMDREDASEAGEDEFVCTNCYLVKRVSQLANPRKKICKDCAA